MYRKARLIIESGDEAKAVQIINKLHNNPFYDLNWTIQQSLFNIPCGHRLYESIIGCPSCRGDYSSLLFHAVRSGSLSIAQELVSLGASIQHYEDGGYWTLTGAIHSGNIDMVSFILSKGAKHSSAIAEKAPSSMHFAVWQCSDDIFDLLLSDGASINALDMADRTPLDWAIIWKTNAVPYLVSHGAVTGKEIKHNHGLESTGAPPAADALETHP